jgi:hypothetical protein
MYDTEYKIKVWSKRDQNNLVRSKICEIEMIILDILFKVFFYCFLKYRTIKISHLIIDILNNLY